MQITKKPGRSRLARREAVAGFLFLAPWIIGLIAFKIGPMIASLVLSFTEYKIVSPPVVVGLTNFIKIFTQDESFRDSLRVTFTYALVAVPIGLALGLLVAVLMNQKVPGITVWRTIYYLPTVVSGVAVSMLWLWLFNSEFGLINTALRAIGIQGPAWLADPDWALTALILMSFWSIGGAMVVNLAGLQNIPTELYEAASIDGATRFRRFLHITLPMLSPVLFFNLIIGVIGTFQYFTEAYVMTGGGPGRATLFYNLYLYENAFRYYKMGYASALAWVMFLIILIFTMLVFKSSPYWVYYEGMVKNTRQK